MSEEIINIARAYATIFGANTIREAGFQKGYGTGSCHNEEVSSTWLTSIIAAIAINSSYSTHIDDIEIWTDGFKTIKKDGKISS